jgi:hypothetical protein
LSRHESPLYQRPVLIKKSTADLIKGALYASPSETGWLQRLSPRDARALQAWRSVSLVHPHRQQFNIRMVALSERSLPVSLMKRSLRGAKLAFQFSRVGDAIVFASQVS